MRKPRDFDTELKTLADKAKAINGAVIPVDGGQNAPSAYGY